MIKIHPVIPLHLKLSGFLSYRDPVEVDFSSFDLACISGSNGAGKSSLLDAMTWALFGQARKRDEAVVNLQSKAAEVAFTFAYENNIYRVIRSLPRGKDHHAGIPDRRRRQSAIFNRKSTIDLASADRTHPAGYPGAHRADPAPGLRYLCQRIVLPAGPGRPVRPAAAHPPQGDPGRHPRAGSLGNLPGTCRRTPQSGRTRARLGGRACGRDRRRTGRGRTPQGRTWPNWKASSKDWQPAASSRKRRWRMSNRCAPALDKQRELVRKLGEALERSQANLAGLQARLAVKETERSTHAELVQARRRSGSRLCGPAKGPPRPGKMGAGGRALPGT